MGKATPPYEYQLANNGESVVTSAFSVRDWKRRVLSLLIGLRKAPQ